MRSTVFNVLLLAIIPAQLFSRVLASELESLRLFNEPNKFNTVESRSEKQLNKPAAESLAAKVPAGETFSNHSAPVRTEYIYNGFIKTEAGFSHFVNGIPMTQLKSIKLVSVNEQGRSLSLISDHGHAFTLLVGESQWIVNVPVKSSSQQQVSAKGPASHGDSEDAP